MKQYFITTVLNNEFSNLWLIINGSEVRLFTEGNNLITEFRSNSIEEKNVVIRRAISRIGQLHEYRRIF